MGLLKVNKADVIKMYNDGFHLRDIAIKYNVGTNAIRQSVKKSGSECKKRIIFKNDQTKEELAYAAGLLDGEGTIPILKKKRFYKRVTKNWVSPVDFNLRVEIVNTNSAAIEWLLSKFGGNIQKTEKAKYRPNRRAIYRWGIYNQHAKEFLKSVLPYLIIKKDQAELAIEFISRIGNNSKITPDELKIRQQYKDRIEEMRKANEK